MSKIHICRECNAPMGDVADGWYCAMCSIKEAKPPATFLPGCLKAFRNLLLLSATGFTIWAGAYYCNNSDEAKAAKTFAVIHAPHKHLIYLEELPHAQADLGTAYIKWIEGSIEASLYSANMSVKSIQVSDKYTSLEITCEDSVWEEIQKDPDIGIEFKPRVVCK